MENDDIELTPKRLLRFYRGLMFVVSFAAMDILGVAYGNIHSFPSFYFLFDLLIYTAGFFLMYSALYLKKFTWRDGD